MKFTTETKSIITIEWMDYKVIFANKKNVPYLPELINQFNDVFDIIKVVPPKNIISLPKPKDEKIFPHSIDDLKKPTKNQSNQTFTMDIWNTVKERLNEDFTVKEFQEKCIACGFEKDIKNEQLYNRLNNLCKKKIIIKLRDLENIPLSPLTYRIVKKENPIDYLKNSSLNEAKSFRDSAKMS